MPSNRPLWTIHHLPLILVQVLHRGQDAIYLLCTKVACTKVSAYHPPPPTPPPPHPTPTFGSTSHKYPWMLPRHVTVLIDWRGTSKVLMSCDQKYRSNCSPHSWEYRQTYPQTETINKQSDNRVYALYCTAVAIAMAASSLRIPSALPRWMPAVPMRAVAVMRILHSPILQN